MKHILCIALLACTFAGRAQTPNELFKHLPADADHVLLFNLNTITSKVDPASIIAVFKGHHTMEGHQALKPEDLVVLLNSGIDFQKDVVVVTSNAYQPDSNRYTSVIFHLSDSAKFGKAARKMVKHWRPIHLAGTIHPIADSVNTFAWDDKYAVILTVKQAPGHALVIPSHMYMARRCIAALRENNNTFFTTDPHFLTAFNDDADIHIWNRHADPFGFTKMLMGNKGSLSPMSQLATTPNADPTIGDVKFEQGKIVYRTLRLLSPGGAKGLQHLTGLNEGQSLSRKLVAAAPPGDLLAMITMHFNMSAWADSMSRSPLAMIFLSKLQKQGLNTQDIGKALQGDFMGLVYNEHNASAKPMPSIYAVTTITDKASFDRVAKALKMHDATTPDDLQTSDSVKTWLFSYYAVQGDLAVLGSTRESVNAFFNHPAATSDPTARLLWDKAYTNSFSGGIDMQAVAGFLAPVLAKGDTTAHKNQAILDALHQLDLVKYASGSIHDDAMETDLELRMTDPNKNALATFVNMVLSIRAAEPEKTPK